ncbi:MAG: putative Na+/H+ antiporter [Desulfobacterales bacterium]
MRNHARPEKRPFFGFLLIFCLALGVLAPLSLMAASEDEEPAVVLPRDLKVDEGPGTEGIPARLLDSIRRQPFNAVVTLIFFGAIVHTFLSSRFLAVAHRWEHEHEVKKERGQVPSNSVHHGAELFHFLGEVEAVFGVWVIPLVAAIVWFFEWPTAVDYISRRVNFTEAMFVVVIMTLASTRPILKISEAIMARIAGILGGSLTSWWFTILTVGPILGSFITEPAAMTISALLISDHFFTLSPDNRFKYATIGLLFVNISVGGVLTHFAAPPVLMVAGPWDWNTPYMFINFGWKAILTILAANSLYFLFFRSELRSLEEPFQIRKLKREILSRHLPRESVETELDHVLEEMDVQLGFRNELKSRVQSVIDESRKRLEARLLKLVPDRKIDPDLLKKAFEHRIEEITVSRLRRIMPAWLPESQRAPFRDPDWDQREDPVPPWIIVVHVLFMGWTIFNSHYPALFVPGLLFFLGFAQVTAPYQNRIDLKPPILVGFFLGGLVIHGGLQGWWIEPVLGSLAEFPLMLSATVLTAFNDNAAITYLSTLVPNLSVGMKHAVVAGAVVGGGLTVIANAPNPAGQTILKAHFENGVSPAGLLAGALVPTIVTWAIFWVLG